MKASKAYTDKHFIISDIDRRIYGSFAEHMGRCIYEGIYQPGNKFSDENGLRRDVLDLVKKQGVSLVRYPGGNFVSAYHWENTVGPKSERKTMIEPAWRSIDTNEFGLNEFMDWAKLAEIEPMMAINLGTRGVDAAIHLLEYCNHPGGTYYSDLRRSHGYEKPHNIRLWCLGNEMDGPWQIGHKPADEYGRLAWQAGKVMKMIDPTLELAVCGSAGTALPTFGSWDATVVENTYDICDYLSMHIYFDNRNKTPDDTRAFLASSVEFERQIEDVIACCDYVRAKLKKKKKINISIDEWNVVYRPHGKVPPIDWTQASHQIEDVYCMEDVIVVGNALISMLKHADRVKIGCQAQLVNVIAPIMTSDNGVWLQTIYYPFAHCTEYGQGKSIKILFDSGTYYTKKHGDVQYLDGALVENEEKEELTLFVVNRDLDDAHTLDIDLRQYEGYEVAKHIVVNHDDLRATNTEENPFNVVPRENGISKLSDGKLEAVLEAHSWNVIVMKKHK